jgi:hypothetical protein
MDEVGPDSNKPIGPNRGEQMAVRPSPALLVPGRSRQILSALGLPATTPTFAPARAPPKRRFEDDSEPACAHRVGSEKADPNGDHPTDDFGDSPAWDELDPA